MCGVLAVDVREWLDVGDIDGRLVALGALEDAAHTEERLAGDDEAQAVEGFGGGVHGDKTVGDPIL